MRQEPCGIIATAEEPSSGLKRDQPIGSRAESPDQARSWWTAPRGLLFLFALCLGIGAGPLGAELGGGRSVTEELTLLWQEMDLEQVRFDSRCLKAISLFSILAGACIAVLQAATTSKKARYVSVVLGVLITASVTTQDTFFRTDFWTLDYVLEDVKSTLDDFRFEWQGKDLSDGQLRKKYRMELIRLRKKVRDIKNRARSSKSETRIARSTEVGGWGRFFFRYAYAGEVPQEAVAPAWYLQPAAEKNKISVDSYGFDPELERSLGKARIVGQLLFLERFQKSIAREMARLGLEDPSARAFEVTWRVMDVLGPFWDESIERKDFQRVAHPSDGLGYQTFLRTEVDVELLHDIFFEFTDGVLQDPSAAREIFSRTSGALTRPMKISLEGRNDTSDRAVDLFRQGRREEAVVMIRRQLEARHFER